MVYTIVPEKEANFKENKISINSPIGQGLLGKKVGEIAEEIARRLMVDRAEGKFDR